jgi:hypothetical protein
LFSGYRIELWWWEMTIVIRKVCMVVVGGVFGSRLGPDMQVYMALFLVVVFIVVHLAARPFDELTSSHKILHWLELGALLVCWGTLYSGMLFWLGSTASGRFAPELLVLISFTIIFGNILFTLFLVLVYVRAVHYESKKDGEHSEEALRKRVKQRLAAADDSKQKKKTHLPNGTRIRTQARFKFGNTLRNRAVVDSQSKHIQKHAQLHSEILKRKIRIRQELQHKRLKERVRNRSDGTGFNPNVSSKKISQSQLLKKMSATELQSEVNRLHFQSKFEADQAKQANRMRERLPKKNQKKMSKLFKS